MLYVFRSQHANMFLQYMRTHDSNMQANRKERSMKEINDIQKK